MRSRGLLLKIYVALIGAIVLAITLAEGYAAYAQRDPTVPFEPSALETLISGSYPLAVLRVLGFGALGLGYLLPLFVADFRGHRDRPGIAIVNAAFGWTILGWIVAACWAATPAAGL